MQKISILIPSCDKYFDLWPILSESYLKFRNDCPFKIFIITNSEIKVPKPFFALNIGEDISRSDNCIKALSIINSKYILMHIDDLILNKKVNTEKILNRINLGILNNMNYLKLLNTNNNYNKKKSLNEMDIMAPYRASTVFSLRKKETLLKILKPGENPRQLEINGTERSRAYNNWFYSNDNCFSFQNLVIKGVIEKIAMKKLSKIGLLYKGDRKVMTYYQSFIHHLKGFIFNIIMILPNLISNPLIILARKIG